MAMPVSYLCLEFRAQNWVLIQLTVERLAALICPSDHIIGGDTVIVTELDQIFYLQFGSSIFYMAVSLL